MSTMNLMKTTTSENLPETILLSQKFSYNAAENSQKQNPFFIGVSRMRDPGQHDIGGANRDLVLAPGEYAYLQGETSGRVGVGVGPCTINQTGQDRPVGFDGRSFETCPLDESVRMCPIAKGDRAPRKARRQSAE